MTFKNKIIITLAVMFVGLPVLENWRQQHVCRRWMAGHRFSIVKSLGFPQARYATEDIIRYCEYIK